MQSPPFFHPYIYPLLWYAKDLNNVLITTGTLCCGTILELSVSPSWISLISFSPYKHFYLHFILLGSSNKMEDILPPPPPKWKNVAMATFWWGCLTSSLIVFRFSSTMNVDYTCVIEKSVVKFVNLENFLIIKAAHDLYKMKEGSGMQKV